MIDPARSAFPWLLAPVLLPQAAWVRARTVRLSEAAGPDHGIAGKGPGLTLLGLGDSIIAGVGVEHTQQALTAQLARSLSTRLGRSVAWRSHGWNGARTVDLAQWVEGKTDLRADLLLVSNGLNDVTGLAALDAWLARKSVLLARIRQRSPDALVLQLGIPPLDSFPALPRPLRSVLGRRARAFDRALADLCADFSRVLHLPFRSRPEPKLFADDGYHPGPEAVRRWADELAAEIVQRTGWPL